MKDKHNINDLKVGMWCVCDANLAIVVKINEKKATAIKSSFRKSAGEYYCELVTVYPDHLIALTDDENLLPPLVVDRIPGILKTYSEYQMKQQKKHR